MATIFQMIQVSGTAYGALVVYYWAEREATIYSLDSNGSKGQVYYAHVKEYQGENGQHVCAAIFPMLPPGNYLTYQPGYNGNSKHITVFPGFIAEVKYS